ncbi:DUF6087 family protein [Streptomyces sp. NRRL S-31]|uniref:DUF6087 family protein n=1 Tax=Streptomyces sp. NRRL S-31 TaxID=1463898 RepID=UPI0009A0FA40|nr:DUF6087 family protein [Streptomyces sp. NRRL S-31]
MEEEPLEEWAARRDLRRPTAGERRAVPLEDQTERGAHVAPDAPRGLQEWDGSQWVPVGVAEDLPAAAAETGDGADARAARVSLPRFGKLPPAVPPWRPTEPFHRP